MVKKYERKTSNASWDEEVMKLVIEEAGKTSINSAAKKVRNKFVDTTETHKERLPKEYTR